MSTSMKNIMNAIVIVMILGLTGCATIETPSLASTHKALALIDQGTLYLRQGEIDRAEASFRVANEIAPHAAAVDGLGCVSFLKGDLAHAEELFLEAYNMDPSYDNSLGNLALLYDLKGMREKARTMYERSIHVEPQNFRARNNFGAFLINSIGDEPAIREAKDELLKAESLNDHPLIKHNLKTLE